MSEKFITVKIPVWVYDSVRSLQEELVRKGTQALPKAVREKVEAGAEGNRRRQVSIGVLLGVAVEQLHAEMKGKR